MTNSLFANKSNHALGLSLALTACFAAPLSLAREAPKPGFSGEVALNAAYTSSTSNLRNTDDEFRVYDGQAQKDSGALVLPLANFQYGFGQEARHQVFFGTSRADIAIGILALETGYQYRFEDGSKWRFSLLPTVLKGEVWQDPYLNLDGSDDPRKTTDESGMAYRLQIDNLAGSLFSLDLGYGSREVDEERSGSDLSQEQQALLERNADIFYGKFKMMLPISKNLLLFPALITIQQDADGDAMANESYGAELASFGSLGKHQFAFTLSYLNRRYDADNPIPAFNQTRRKDDVWKAFLAYEYPGIFYSEDVSLVAFSGYTDQQSNIAFYEESSWISALGLSWAF